MTSYSVPDNTGKNPAYLQVNLPFYIYENNIKLKFENSPVFASSIRMILTDGSSLILQKDVHWKIDASDIDQTAMSKAFLENRNFSEQLLQSVTFISPDIVGKQIAVNVQQFYDTIPGRLFDDGSPIQFSPALLKSLISGLADVRQQIAKVRSPVTPNDHAPVLLKFDINAERASNVITGEKVTVNTVAGGKVIRLVQGAFFADSLVIKKDGVPLSKTTDYLVIFPSPLTKQSTNKSGIYQFIHLVTPITGELTIDYHALGGEVQQDDVAALYDLAVSLKTFLNEQIFVTADTISETAAFRALHARLQTQEDKMRSLLSGSPSYGDANTNTNAGYSLVRRPIAASDAKLHWYTIASLFKVAGSTDVVLTDQFRGRIFLPGTKIALSFVVDVNFNQTRNPVTITSSNLVFNPLYNLFVDLDNSAPVYPMLRVAWNRISDGLSGAVLQVGLPLPNLTDQMVLENTSTPESCWLLDKTGQIVTGNSGNPSSPKDNGFTLPDGNAVWSDGSASSLSRVHVPVYRPGYLMYQGAVVTLADLAGAGVLAEKPTTPGNSTKNKFNIVLPSYFPLSTLSQIVVTMASTDTAAVYDIELDIAALNGTSRFGKRGFTDTGGKRMTMSATLTQDINSAIAVSLNVSDTPSGPADVVRYIRARV